MFGSNFRFKFFAIALLVVIGISFAAFPQKPISKFKSGVSGRLSASTVTSFTRRSCYSTQYENLLKSKYPQLGTRDDFEQSLRRVINARQSLRTQSISYDTLPVIVHVISNGDLEGVYENISQDQVNSQIEVLNQDFGRINTNTLSFSSDSYIRFAPALIDPYGNYLTEPGINRVSYPDIFGWEQTLIDSLLKPQTQWDPTAYVNVWVVTFTGASSDLLGYAQFPSKPDTGLTDLQSSAISNTDGVVIAFGAFGNRGLLFQYYNTGHTTSHELGHYLGIYHPWGDVDTCGGTDYCADTPPCAGSLYYCIDTIECGDNVPRLISNYMEYSFDSCMTNFTNDQIGRMQAVLGSSIRRKSLLNRAPFPFFLIDNNLRCVNDSITFYDQSVNSIIYNPTNYGITTKFTFYKTGSPYPLDSTSGTVYPFGQSGVYDVVQTSSNSIGSRTSPVRSQKVGVISSNNLWIPYSENFEGPTVLSNWITFNLDTITNWKVSPTQIAPDDGVLKTVIGSNGLPTHTYYSNNYQEDFTGTTDLFISPVINLNGLTSPTLSFDVAYATIVINKVTYTDSLQILITTNCGTSFTTLWQQGGNTLATSSINYKGFVPRTNTDWKNVSISLANFTATGSFHLAFVNLSGYGNNLFVDNIKLTATPTLLPISNFQVPSEIVCLGKSVQYTDSSLNIPTSWSWSFSGGGPSISNSADQNPTVKYTSIGTSTSTLIASNSIGNGNSVTKTITIIAPPTLTQTDSLMTSSLATGNQWYYNNFPIPGATAASIIATASGIYFVVNTNAAPGCNSTIGVITGIPEVPVLPSPEVNLYPNPATNELTILVPNILGGNELIINIFSIMGTEYTVPSTNNTDQGSSVLDISNLSPGAYIARVSVGGKSVFKRWVKL